MNRYETIHDAYLGTLADIFDNPDCVSAPRDQKVREKFNYQFTILKPTVEWIKTFDEERNKVIEDYSAKEFELYNSMTNRAEDFGKASKFWLKLANPDGTVNSAYGYLIWKQLSHGNDFEQVKTECEAFSQKEIICATEDEILVRNNSGKVYEYKTLRRTPWDWAKLSLIQDKDTRQAILRFSLPEHQWMGNKDQTCTMHGIFMIRENKLNLTINMRSNDMTLGLVYDMPWFISLMYRMRDELKNTYPDLQIGCYNHYVHNIHVYDRDTDKILKMLGRQ